MIGIGNVRNQDPEFEYIFVRKSRCFAFGGSVRAWFTEPDNWSARIVGQLSRVKQTIHEKRSSRQLQISSLYHNEKSHVIKAAFLNFKWGKFLLHAPYFFGPLHRHICTFSVRCAVTPMALVLIWINNPVVLETGFWFKKKIVKWANVAMSRRIRYRLNNVPYMRILRIHIYAIRLLYVRVADSVLMDFYERVHERRIIFCHRFRFIYICYSCCLFTDITA